MNEYQCQFGMQRRRECIQKGTCTVRGTNLSSLLAKSYLELHTSSNNQRCQIISAVITIMRLKASESAVLLVNSFELSSSPLCSSQKRNAISVQNRYIYRPRNKRGATSVKHIYHIIISSLSRFRCSELSRSYTSVCRVCLKIFVHLLVSL
jgi:hypothetical protein